MSNKWLKWIVGIGGVTSFTLFLQTIDASDQSSSGFDENYVLENNMNVKNVQEALTNNPEEREKQLMALDWEEGNWDVEYSNEVIIATPRSQTPSMDRAEQRTRRS